MTSTQNVLFDAPGPKARARHLALTVFGAILVAGILAFIIWRFAQAGQLEPAMWTPFVTDGGLWTEYLLPGIKGTLVAAALAIVFAGIFGVVFGLGRLSSVAPVRWVCGVIVEFFRAVPVLLMMVFAYFGFYVNQSVIPSDQAPLAAVVTGLTLYNGSVIAELIRSGVHGLPDGQREAGLSIGLTPSQTTRTILLPQALTAMLPTLVSQLVVVLKDTALGYAITYFELLTWAKTMGSAYSNTIPAYIVAAVLFILINYTLSRAAGWLEGKLQKRQA